MATRGITIQPADIIESEDHYILSTAQTGMQKENFKISFEGPILWVRSQKEEVEERVARTEFNRNSFSRSFTLPKYVKPDYIQAKYEDGLLQIRLPQEGKVKQTTAIKQIAVQ